MDAKHGFSFLLGALLAWAITRQSFVRPKSSDEDWILHDISRSTDDEIMADIERCKEDMAKRKITGFSPRNIIQKDPAGQQYLHNLRILQGREILKSNGWHQSKQ